MRKKRRNEARRGARSGGAGSSRRPLALGACVETTADIAPDPDAHASVRPPRRGRTSPAPASPSSRSKARRPAIAAQFRRPAQARGARRATSRRRRRQGALSGARLSLGLADEDGASVEYVWDVFTADKQRAQRLNDVIAVKGEGDDPWALAGDAALASVAAKSADDLAAYLSYTPEASPVSAAAQPAAQWR